MVESLRNEKRLKGWNARAAVNLARNTGKLPNTWQRFEWMNIAAYEVRRALWGIDGPNAWCGRNARLWRYVVAHREFDLPRLP